MSTRTIYYTEKEALEVAKEELGVREYPSVLTAVLAVIFAGTLIVRTWVFGYPLPSFLILALYVLAAVGWAVLVAWLSKKVAAAQKEIQEASLVLTTTEDGITVSRASGEELFSSDWEQLTGIKQGKEVLWLQQRKNKLGIPKRECTQEERMRIEERFRKK